MEKAVMNTNGKKPLMKRFVLGLALMLGSLVGLSSCSYNTIVESEQNVDMQWAQVQNVYQRRADLIPNLVNTVKGAADFEKSTLTQVIEARAKATSITINPANMTQQQLDQFQSSQNGLTSALGKLMVVAEKYPELKTNQNFLELQAQLEGTENRISVERNKYNEAVKDYNMVIKKFPSNLTAMMFGFQPKPYFAAQPGSETAPTVQF